MEQFYKQLLYENTGKHYESFTVQKSKTVEMIMNDHDLPESISIQIMKAKCCVSDSSASTSAASISHDHDVMLRVVKQCADESDTLYQRELRACRVIQSLQPNENICEILHVIESVKKNTRYLVIIMPCYREGDLDEYVECMKKGEKSQFSTEVLFDLAFRLTRVLTVLHTDERKLIHRDFSLHNILIEEIGKNYCRIRVIDFEQVLLLAQESIDTSIIVGESHSSSSSDSSGSINSSNSSSCDSSVSSEKQASFSVGKLHINAPEVKHRKYSPHIDVWSLGCVLYQVITQDMNTVLSTLSQSEIWKLIFDGSDQMKRCQLAPFIWSCLQIEPSRRMNSQHIMETLLMAWYFYFRDLKGHESEMEFQNCLLEGIYRMSAKEHVDSIDVVAWMQKQKENLPSELHYLADCICLLKNPNDFGDHLKDSPLAYVFKGMNMTDNHAAIECYSKAIDLNPTHPYVYLNRGFRLEKLNDYDSALEDYCTAISLNPSEKQVYINRGSLYHNMKQYDLAIQDFNKAIEIDPNDFEMHFNRGLIYETIGQLENALDEYSCAIELNPEDIPSLYRRGSIYLKYQERKQQQLLDQAVQDFTTIILLDEKDAKSYHARGLCYLELSEYELAIEDFTTCMKLDPSLESKTVLERGKAFFYVKDFDNAMNDFCRAIELIEQEPKNVRAYSYRANVYSLFGMIQEAIEDFSMEIEFTNESPQALAQRGFFYSLQHEYQKAIDDCTKSIEIDPMNGHPYYNRACVYDSLGDYEQAIRDFSSAIQCNPSMLQSYLDRGDVYMKKKDYQSAIMDFSLVISASHDVAQIKRACEQRALACSALGLPNDDISDESSTFEDGLISCEEEKPSLNKYKL
nr:unnamed protein product [Naegleria fowleri]